MEQHDRLPESFEQNRSRLRAVAYQLLGSLSEAEDAVQEAWLRLSRAETSEIENLSAWLTTVVARVSLNMLRSRRARREELIGVHVPDPIVDCEDSVDPEHEALLAETVGLALLVMLETLAPAERLAVVLHDMFAVPFDEIAPIIDRSPTAARQLASRARRRLRASTSVADSDMAQQRELVSAYLAAAREGDFDLLLTVLDPDVVLRADAGLPVTARSAVVHGANAVARRALAFAQPERITVPVLVNGAGGVVAFKRGQLDAVLGFTVRARRIVQIDVLADPARLARLDLGGLHARRAPPASR